MSRSVNLEVDRKRVLPYLIVAAILLGFSVLAIVSAPTTTIFRSETFVRLIGVFGGAGALYMTVRAAWLLWVSPGLELTPDALAIRITGPPTRIVTWDNLERVSYGSQHTFLHLNSGKRLRLNPWVKGLSGSLRSQALAETITSYGASIGWREIDAT